MHPIPLIVLGGSDRRAATLPTGADAATHPLLGYKGLELQVDGRPLVQVIIERMAATGAFAPIFIVGPERLYAPVTRALPEVRVIDQDGSFGENIRISVETVQAELGSEYIAFTTCDILPDPAELALAVADLERHLPLDFWMPHIPIDPQALGSSTWKPRYRMRPPGAPEALPTLPGHLVIGALDSIRLDFVYKLFELFYRTRNSSVTRRCLEAARGMLLHMIGEDLRSLAAGRKPYALWTVFAEGLKIGALLVRGTATTRDLEDRIRKVCMTRRHRRLFPTRRGRIAMLDVLSLARDIDTAEEARELTGVDVDSPVGAAR